MREWASAFKEAGRDSIKKLLWSLVFFAGIAIVLMWWRTPAGMMLAGVSSGAFICLVWLRLAIRGFAREVKVKTTIAMYAVGAIIVFALFIG